MRIIWLVFCCDRGCWRLRIWRRQSDGSRTPGCAKHDALWLAEVRDAMRESAAENPDETLIERDDGTTALVQGFGCLAGVGLGVETADDLEAITHAPGEALRFDQLERKLKRDRKSRRRG